MKTSARPTKKQRCAIASVFTALSPSPYSHGSGFARIFSSQLATAGIEHDIIWSSAKGVDWNDYDVIYLYQGLDLNGKLGINMFGGPGDSNAKLIGRLASFRGTVKPIAYPLADYQGLLHRDWSAAKGFDAAAAAEALGKLQEATHHKAVVKNPTGSHHLCLGDSHTPSVWIDGTHLEVLSGKTLYGALQQGLCELVQPRYSSATLYFGNIDVRHHLARDKDARSSFDAVRTLTSEYVAQIRRLIKRGVSCEVCELLPIEDESREIPGPGKYKGQGFWGPWDLRNAVRNEFNQQMGSAAKRYGFTMYKHPKHFLNDKGQLSFDVMERPRSVHIAPQFYRSAASIGL